MKREENQRPERDQQQVVRRELAAGDRDRAFEAGRARPEAIFRAPEPQREILEEQHQRESREQLQQLGRAVDPAQEHGLDERASRRDERRGRRDARPEADRWRERHGGIHAQHVKRAVREVDDARDAEDQRQPGGDQEQRRSVGQAVQELQQDG